MKSLLTVLIALLITLPSYAQNNLSGTITDSETSELMPGVHVYIPDLHKGATTNIDGFYEIKELPKGSFLVEIGYLSYSTQVIKTIISGNTTLNVALSHAITEMDEIVVTGTSASTERELNPIPSIVIDHLSNSETPSTNIIDAITTQPGISQITTGGAISKPVIRGLGFNRVVVLNNNIRQEGQQWGDEHGIEIDEYAVDRVEIIKGPGSLMYGSDAMAGVIHFLAPKPIEQGRIIGQLMTNYQSNNNLVGYSAMGAGNNKGINWVGRVSGKNVGNYANAYDGKVYNSGFRELNYNGSVGINKKWGFSQLYLSQFNQTLGLVEGERDSLGQFTKPFVVNDSLVEERTVTSSDLMGYQIGIPKQDIGHFKIGSSSKFYLNNSVLAVNLAYQSNRRKEFADPFDEDAEELYFQLQTINYDIKYLFPESKGWHTSIGLNGMQQSNQNKGEEFLIPEYNLFDVGMFAITQKTFDKLHISGGVRYDIRHINAMSLFLNPDGEPTDGNDTLSTVKFTPFNNTYSNISGSLGASYRLSNRFTLKLNVSRGFRSPNMAELSSNGIHEGTFRYEIGNNQLRPETSLQLDAGLVYNSEHISFELATFSNAIDNYIFIEKLSSVFGGDSIVDPSEPTPAFEFIHGNAHLYGGELSIDIHPHPLDWLHFENTFSYVRGVQADQPDSTKYLPFMPAAKWQSVLRANFKNMGDVFKNIYARVDLTYTFRQLEIYSAFGTETPTSDYALLNAGIGSDIINRKGNTLFSVSLTVSNILDKAYQSHLSRLKYAPENIATGRTGVYNMGRNFNVRLIVPITIK